MRSLRLRDAVGPRRLLLIPGREPARPEASWPRLLGLSLAQTVSWGVVYYSFPVMVRPMEAELGWSRPQLMVAFSVALLASGLAAVPIGSWLDARGGRLVMSGGSTLAALLLLAWSQVESLPALYAVWAGLGVAMAAVLYEPAFAVMVGWFDRRRDRALAVLTVFGGLASTVFVPLSAWLTEWQGWRAAVAGLALILAATTIPVHVFLLRGRPVPRPPAPRDAAAPSGLRTALASVAFRRLAVGLVASSLAGSTVSAHLLAFLGDAEVSAGDAALTMGAVGAMQVPGRLLYASKPARIRADQALVGVLGVQAMAVLAFPWLASGPIRLVACGLFGMASGMVMPLRASTVADQFGRGQYARLGGALALVGTLARAGGPLGAAVVHSSTGSYVAVWPALAAGLVAAAAFVGTRDPGPGTAALGRPPEWGAAEPESR